MHPVVLLHGARVSRSMWRPQLAALQRAGRLALAIDLPGHGTRTGEHFTMPAALAAVDAAVQQVGGRAVVVGMSLGGYVGISYAARNPDRTVGLVASGCCTVPDQPVTAAWILASRLILRLPDHGAWLNRKLIDLTFAPDAVRDIGAGGFALAAMVDLLAEVRRTDPVGDLRRITCPVWLLNGQWDHFRLQERRFAAACPTARVVTVRGAHHIANLARPLAYNRALLTALAELDALP